MERLNGKPAFRLMLARQRARLEWLLRELLTGQAEDGADATKVFSAFADQLRRRISIQRSFVFVAFEEAAGLVHEGPTQSLRREHQDIKRRLDQVSNVLARGATLPDDRPQLYALDALLCEHLRLEDLVLVGICERLNGDPALANAARELIDMTMIAAHIGSNTVKEASGSWLLRRF